jgi:hypothetical protein
MEENRDLSKLEGDDLTRELLNDVYAAGTSDGIHQLAEHEVFVPNEPPTIEGDD